MSSPARETLGIIAGKGEYPETLIRAARKGNPSLKIIVVAFQGETKPELEQEADAIAWFRVGQLSKPAAFLKRHNVTEAVMVGQITPDNLFNLRPDLAALILLASLKERNAESIFGKIADYMENKQGIKVLPATTCMQENMPQEGHVCGKKLKKRQLEDALFGMKTAKEVSRLDIGQTVIVRHGTVLAVEGFEGTNECIRRGGALGHGKDVTLVKVSKPHQDMRFDVPCIGPHTILNCREAGVGVIIIDAGKTILLEKEKVFALCEQYGISIHAIPSGD